MKLKYHPLDICLIISCCLYSVKTQEDHDNQNVSSSDCSNHSLTKILISDPNKDLKNINPNSSVLVLIPSGVNITDSLINNENFNLFKLNTDLILNRETETQKEKIDDISETTSSSNEGEIIQESEINSRSSREISSNSEQRIARRFSLLRGLWNRSRSGPLYLVNGTVCRFVNATPICTTLSTSGLIRPGGGGSSGGGTSGSSGGGGGGSSGGGGGGAARPPASGVQSSGSSVQFVDQSLNQRPRPAAVMDDDSQDINVGNISVSTEDTGVVRNQLQQQLQQQQPQQQQTQQQTLSQQTQPIVPSGVIVNRRPLNLLAPFRRPVRQFVVASGRTYDKSQNKQEQELHFGQDRRQVFFIARSQTQTLSPLKI